MKHLIICNILKNMNNSLTSKQYDELKTILYNTLSGYEITKIKDFQRSKCQNQEYVELFLSAKKVEGCSFKTIKYYQATIINTLKSINKEIRHIISAVDDLSISCE